MWPWTPCCTHTKKVGDANHPVGTDIVERLSDFTRRSSPCDEAPCWKITRCALPVAIPARQIPGDATYVGGSYSNSTRARPRHRHPQLNGRDFISYVPKLFPTNEDPRGLLHLHAFASMCSTTDSYSRVVLLPVEKSIPPHIRGSSGLSSRPLPLPRRRSCRWEVFPRSAARSRPNGRHLSHQATRAGTICSDAEP